MIQYAASFDWAAPAFCSQPIRASRLKNINPRKFTTIMVPYTSLSTPEVVLKIVSRSRALELSVARQLVSPPYFPCASSLAISRSRKFFHGPALVSIYFLDRQRSHNCTIPRKCKTVCSLPCRPPCQSIFGSCGPPKARHFASYNNPRRTTFKDSTKQENFDAPPSQMIPYIPFLSRGFI